jgi:hypothetical protein
MSRTLTSPVSTALAAESVRLAYLVELAFDTAPLRIWTGKGAFEWTAGGRTFAGYGDLLNVSPVEETENVEANGLEVTLSGTSPTIISVLLSENYRNRRVRVWLALFDPTSGALLADPVSIFAGRMDVIALTDAGESAQVRVSCESKLIDLKRPRERRLTHEDQQDLYAGDLGLEYVAGLQDKETPWGRKA